MNYNLGLIQPPGLGQQPVYQLLSDVDNYLSYFIGTSTLSKLAQVYSDYNAHGGKLRLAAENRSPSPSLPHLLFSLPLSLSSLSLSLSLSLSPFSLSLSPFSLSLPPDLCISATSNIIISDVFRGVVTSRAPWKLLYDELDMTVSDRPNSYYFIAKGDGKLLGSN